MKIYADAQFFIQLFVPQTPPNSFYRRAESGIQLAFLDAKRLRNGD